MTIRTQTRSPGTVVSDDSVGTLPWSDPEGAESEGGDAANATGPGTTEYLLATGFGFSPLATAVLVTLAPMMRRRAARAGAGALWTDRNTAAGAGTEGMRGVAFGPDGEILLVGLTGFVATSTDGGATWSNRKTAAGSGSTNLTSCDIGPDGEMIIAGESGFLRTSVDGGANWIDRKAAAGTGSNNVRAAKIGPSGEMLIVGASGLVATSTDGGANWTDRNSVAGTGTSFMATCAIGPSGQMIIGGVTGFVATSTNGGVGWTNRKTAASTGSLTVSRSAIAGDGTMLLAATSGYIRTSADGGTSWTDRSTAAGSGSTGFQGAGAGPNGILIAVGTSGYIRTSTDGGATWTDRKSAAGTSTTIMRAAAIGPDGQMVATGDSGYIRTSIAAVTTDSAVKLVVGGDFTGSSTSDGREWAEAYQTDTLAAIDISGLEVGDVDSDFGYGVSCAIPGSLQADVVHGFAVLTYDLDADCAFTSHADEGTLDRPNATFEWSATVAGSAITQGNYRIQGREAGVLVYDTGVVVSATQEHEIGSGTPTLAWANPTNGAEIVWTLTVTDNGTADPDGVGDPITGTTSITLTNDWTPPDAPTGLAVTFVTQEEEGS